MADRVNLLGIGIDAVSIPLVVAYMDRAIRDRTKGYICISGLTEASEAQVLPVFRAILDGASLNAPDGIPLTWLGRSAGHAEMDRVHGPDLLNQACRVSGQTGWRHFFCGDVPGAAERLASTLRAKYSHLQGMDTYTTSNPLSESEKKRLQAKVAAARPDIIWVGLQTPNQQLLMAEALPWLDTTLMVGVGSAFDLLNDQIRQAPRWIQHCGIEWLFRLFQELRRFRESHFLSKSFFILRIFLQKDGLRRSDSLEPDE